MKANGNCNIPERFCHCVELLDSLGNRRPCPPYHDCEYIRARSALVPEAVRIASKRVSVPYGDKTGTASNRWMRCFVEAMNELAKPLLTGSNAKSLAGDTNEATSIGTRVQAHDEGGNNGAREQNGAQNVEMNGGPVLRGRNVIDASSAVIPMW